MDKQESAEDAWDWRETAKQYRILLGLAAIYMIGAIPVMIVLGQGVVIGVVAVLAPVLLGGLLRYIYVRTFQPFTMPLKTEPVLAMHERDAKGSSATKQWSRSEVTATVLFAVLILLAFIPNALVEISAVGEEPTAYMVFAYNLFGSLAILLVMMCLVDLADLIRGAVVFFRTDRAGRGPFLSYLELSDSLRSKRLKSGLVLVLYVITTAVVLAQSYDSPVVIEMDIFLETWPACLDGYTIALVTDVHSGPLVGRKENQRLVEQVNALGADVVVLAGDFGDGLPEDAGPAAEPLGGLTSPDGVYFVTGNHEYLHGSTSEMWPEFWRANGVTVLNNTRVALPLTPIALCDGFDLVGVDDFALGEPDLPGALAGRTVTRPAILAAHQPSQAVQAAEEGISLQLSGHVHGGQTWPLHSLTYVDQAHFAGLEKEGDSMLVYTSLGAFGYGPRTRLFSENNIDLLTLHPSSSLDTDNDLSVNYTIVWAWMGFPFLITSTLLCVVCACPRTFRIPRRAQAKAV